jgi:outer membrane autotransporter protein
MVGKHLSLARRPEAPVCRHFRTKPRRAFARMAAAVAIAALFGPEDAHAIAGSSDATWSAAPADGDWNSAANWVPPGVPTGTATFDATAIHDLTFSSSASIGTLQFNPSAPAYTFTLDFFKTLEINGSGIVNNSAFAPQITSNFGFIFFENGSSAGNSVITNNGSITFSQTSTAANATIITSGGGLLLSFTDSSTAGNASISTDPGSLTQFASNSTGGSATITNNGAGAETDFTGNATPAAARLINAGGGTFEFSATAGPNGDNRIGAGSIEGAGFFFLGSNELTVGSNNLSTTVSGEIDDGGSSGGAGASLVKVGSGTLTLTNASNSYTGGTTIAGGLINFNAAGNFGTGNITLNGGGLQWAAGTAIDISGRLNPIGSNGGVFDTNGNNVIFGSALAGAGGITKQGAGTLTLSAANTYSGGTTIAAGTLALGPRGSLTSSSGVNLAASGAAFDISVAGAQTIRDLSGVAGSNVRIGGNSLTFGTENATTFGGAFAGSGSLTKAGSGTFTLTGDSSGFAGNTTIAAGTLALGSDATPDARLGGNVTVTGGTLQGFGTIGGALSNVGGTVRPGGSIGALTAAGNYTQSAVGTLAIEVSPAAASRLRVGGAASLSGTLALIFDPGIYTARSYTILTASSVTGTFATVTGSNPSGLPQAIVYDPGDVQLQLGASSAPGVTPPAVVAAPVIVVPTNDTIYTAVSSALVLNGQRANSIILDRLGNRSAGIADGEIARAAPAQYAQSGIGDQVGQLASALPQLSEGGWFRGIGSFSSLNGSATAPGFGTAAGGFLAGFDRAIAADAYVGLAGGYLRSEVNEHSTSSGRADTARLALYGGGWWLGNLFTGTAGYARDWTDTSRGLFTGTARQHHGGDEATAAVQWSRPLDVGGFGGGVATLTPKAGFQYLHLSEGGFTETGAGGFDLSGGSRTADSAQPFIGVAVAQKLVTAGGTRFVPEFRLNYAREVSGNARVLSVAAGGGNFLVVGVRPSRDQLTAGLGVAIEAGPMVSVYGNYDGQIRTANTADQTVSAGLRIRF